MTIKTNARIAGIVFLLYIVAGISSMAMHGGGGPQLGIKALLGFVQTFCAIGLGVTLWAITRSEDQEIAMLGMICRVIEGILGALAIPGNSLGSVAFTATFFAVGSLAFAYLLLRGRMIPIALAWIGVIASFLLVIVLPLQVAGYAGNYFWVWIPMLLFEVPLGFWFIVKGVRVAA